MVSVRAGVVSVTALAALIQYCPAPVVAPLVAPLVGAAVRVGAPMIRAAVGTIGKAKGSVKPGRMADKLTEGDGEQEVEEGEGENEKRGMQDMHVIRTYNRFNRIVMRQDPNQRAWDLCREQLGNATVTFSGPAEGEVLAAGMPPACMTLSGVVTDKYNEGNPVPMGVDSILFSGLSEETIDQIEDALSTQQNKI